MTTTYKSPKTLAQQPTAAHPLEPLTPEEIAAAIAIVRQKVTANTLRFETVTLNEPPKSVVLDFQVGDRIQREAFLILLDKATGETIEAIASLTEGAIAS